MSMVRLVNLYFYSNWQICRLARRREVRLFQYANNYEKGRKTRILSYLLKKYKIMSKGKDSKGKNDKKEPAKSLKEKRADKVSKRKEKKSE